MSDEDTQQQHNTQADANKSTSKTKMILISNLPPTINRDQLRELCTPCGRVIDCEIIRKKTGPVGYVSFLTHKDAAYAIYRLQDRLYRDNLLSASAVHPSEKPEKKVRAPKEDVKKKKIKKTPMSLRLLTPINPPTPPPPTTSTTPSQNLSNSTPSEGGSSIPANSQLPPVVVSGNNLSAGGGKSYSDPMNTIQEQERNSPPSDYDNRSRPGGRRRGGGRNTNNNNQFDKRGRRGRSRMNYVVRSSNNNLNDQQLDPPLHAAVNPPAPQHIPDPVVVPPPVVTVPPTIPQHQHQQQIISNSPPPKPQPPLVSQTGVGTTGPSKSAPAAGQNPRGRYISNNVHSSNPSEKYQIKYRPRENQNENNVAITPPPTISNIIPQEKAEFELSLRNIHTNELRFSVLVKLSDVDKVLSIYSNLIQKSF